MSELSWDALTRGADGGTVLDRQFVTQLLVPRRLNGRALPGLTRPWSATWLELEWPRTVEGMANRREPGGDTGAVEKHSQHLSKLDLPRLRRRSSRVLASARLSARRRLSVDRLEESPNRGPPPGRR